MPELMQKFNVFTILIVLSAFILGWQIGHRDIQFKWATYTPSVTIENKEPPKNLNVDFKLFWDTWDLLSKNYFDKKALDPQKMFYGAIQGLVASVGDPYTVFLPPTQQKSSKEELGGSFDGVGIELGFNKDKRLVVISPLEGTPAKKAGILPQDMIVKIDGKDTTNISLLDAVNLIRGPKGSSVKLTVFREGVDATQDFDLNRETIIVKSADVLYQQAGSSASKNTTSGKKIAVIKLSRFGERTKDEWNQVVADVLSKNVDGIILDMRNNPGGFLDGAVFIASEFLPDGDVVLQENSQGQRSPYKVNREGRLLKQPLVVLINKGSASASEIVAGVMQDRKRAKLVGEKSFGKGTIQESEELPGGTGIHITVAKWLTPLGRWVNDTTGFEPDVKVEVPAPKAGESVDLAKDIQLDKALELLD